MPNETAKPHCIPDTANVTLAITGASGSLFAQELLRQLARDKRVGEINLVVSDNALRVIADELGIRGRDSLVEKFLGDEYAAVSQKIRLLDNKNIGASIASGSYPLSAMIVLPCSMGTLAKIANGLADHLIERAADVCLKERAPLLLCVRETPFNLIHLRNMEQVTLAGATIFPLIPAFYAGLATAEEMAREFASRLLKHTGLPQKDAYIWRG